MTAYPGILTDAAARLGGYSGCFMPDETSSTPLKLPVAPVLVANHAGAVWLTPDGEIETLPGRDAAANAFKTMPVVYHAKATSAHLGSEPFPALDVLELLAFVHPAKFCTPTPLGIARFLGLPEPAGLEDQAATLIQAVEHLHRGLSGASADAEGIAWSMGRAGWPWAASVSAAFGGGNGDAKHRAANPADAFRAWRDLPEWSEHAPPPQPRHLPVSPDEAEAQLTTALGAEAEARPQQVLFTREVTRAFDPVDEAAHPRTVLAQAGTGVGKTQGYLAPASLWADRNDGTVWVSTYTRNLQRQLDGELDRVYPNPTEKPLRAVIRKGRENYLCLLNFEDAVGRLSADTGTAIGMGLLARWIGATRDGDMIGGDFPSWLPDLLGFPVAMGLTDRRGECIYSACSHFSKCFIERTVRRARRAKIVVANHALVMVQAALGGDEAYRPARYVFDEGHHIFDAADSAFSAHLSGGETAELRRWFLGAEGRRGSRSRGLRARIEDLIGEDEAAVAALGELLQAARTLPGPGWMTRLTEGNPAGPAESFLRLVRQQVYARDKNADSPYGLETDAAPPVDGMIGAALELLDALTEIKRPAGVLIGCLARQLDDEADDLDTATRQRVEAVARSLERRGVIQVGDWCKMLTSLGQEIPEGFVDWMSVERIGGRDFDIGLHRNWVDPTQPFAETVIAPSDGTLITSATLRDGHGDDAGAWARARLRTGLDKVGDETLTLDVASPFDYPSQTRVFVVSDVDKNDTGQVAAAYRELILAAGGGVLGLFTSIARLRNVHARLVEASGLNDVTMLAQHVDPLDIGTLIDIFRSDEDSCLLGTDAARDGIDVPGRSLRMVIYDRVPWPRPTILHRERKKAFGGSRYDDSITRLRLKQAYGRLIRQAADRGVLVMLDRAMPSRLLDAFPAGVGVRRVGLAQAISESAAFLDRTGGDG